MLSSIAPLYCLWPRFKWSSRQSTVKCVAERRALSHQWRRRKLAMQSESYKNVAYERRFTIGLNLSALNTPAQANTRRNKSARKKSIFVKGTRRMQWEKNNNYWNSFFSYFLIHATKRLRVWAMTKATPKKKTTTAARFMKINKPFEFPKFKSFYPLFVSFIWYACRRECAGNQSDGSALSSQHAQCTNGSAHLTCASLPIFRLHNFISC